MAGTDTYIQLPADSTGKQVRAWSNVINTNTVYAQAMVLTNVDGEVLASATGLFVQGNVASDAAVTANPLLDGGRASTATPTAVSADGDAVPLWLRRTGALVIDGYVASGTTDAGNPVKVGGVYNSTPPTLTNGQRGDLQSTARGSLKSNFADSSAGIDAIDNSAIVYPRGHEEATGLLANARFGYNGTGWDRLRTLDALSAAPNVTTGIQAVGIGPGFDIKLNPSNLGTAVNSAITNVINGAGRWVYYIGTATTGTFTFEVSADDTNWQVARIFQVNGVATAADSPMVDQTAIGNITPALGNIYVVDTAGFRQVRIRTVTTLGATVQVRTTSSLAPVQHALTATLAGIAGDKVQVDTSVADGLGFSNALRVVTMGFLYNGTSWDRARTVVLSDGSAATGILAAGLVGYNGSTWDRVRTANTGRLQVDVVTSSLSQFAEDAASAGGENMTLAGVVRQDTLASSTSTDGDYAYMKVNATGALWTAPQGNVASGATDSGNPVKIGGRYNSSSPSLSDGQRGDLQLDNSARLKVWADNLATSSITDATGPSAISLQVAGFGMGFNGSVWDRLRTIDALSTAPNTTTGILVAGVGPGFDIKLNPSNLATAANSAITNVVNGASIIQYAIGTTTTGTFTFEATADDSNWAVVDAVLVSTGGAAPTYTDVSGTNITPTNNNIYRVIAAGWRQVRIRTVSTLGATVAVKTTAHLGAPLKPTGYSEDTAASGGEILSIAGVVRQDTLASSVSTDGDYAYMKVDSVGRLYVNVGTAAALADAASNPTVPSLGSLNLGFNGTTWDRLRTIDGYAAASAAPAGTLAAIAPDRRYTSVSLGTAANSTQTWDTAGAAETTFYIGTTTTGTYIFEITVDGTNWSSAETYDASGEAWVSGQNLTPTNTKVYRVLTVGARTVRARTVTTLGATVSIVANVVPHTALIRAIDIGPPQHSNGQVWITKTAQYTTTQTGTALWTPASGKRIVVVAYQIAVGGTVAGTMQLWFGASADTTYTRGTDATIFDHEFSPSSTLKPGVVQTGVWVADAVDRVLRVTDSAAINPLTVTVWGYETV